MPTRRAVRIKSFPGRKAAERRKLDAPVVPLLSEDAPIGTYHVDRTADELLALGATPNNRDALIHRTALTSAGEKIGRMVLGPKAGAAIKLSPDGAVTMGLAIAEGIETALSGMQLGWQPAWSVVDAGGITRFPVLSGIEVLTILVDNDKSGTGQRAAIACSDRWTRAGRQVLRVLPHHTGDDLNDIVRKRAVA